MARPHKRLDPIHPGEVLLTEFLEPLGLTQYCLAKHIGSLLAQSASPYDLDIERDRLGDRLERDVPVFQKASQDQSWLGAG